MATLLLFYSFNSYRRCANACFAALFLSCSLRVLVGLGYSVLPQKCSFNFLTSFVIIHNLKERIICNIPKIISTIVNRFNSSILFLVYVYTTKYIILHKCASYSLFSLISCTIFSSSSTEVTFFSSHCSSMVNLSEYKYYNKKKLFSMPNVLLIPHLHYLYNMHFGLDTFP